MIYSKFFLYGVLFYYLTILLSDVFLNWRTFYLKRNDSQTVYLK